MDNISEILKIKCGNDEYYMLAMETTFYMPHLPSTSSTVVIDPIQNWEGQDTISEDDAELLQIVSDFEKCTFRNNPRYRYDKLSSYSYNSTYPIYLCDKRTNAFHYTAHFMDDKNLFYLDETNIHVLKDHWTNDGYVECVVVNTKIVNTNY